MNSREMQIRLKTIHKLPTLPTIAMEVNRLLLDHESPIDQLVTLLEKDPTLVMKILRLVNSSFYGFRSKVNNLRHAVTLLGYNTIRNAVISITVIDTLNLDKELKGFAVDSFWEHAIRVAVMSRYLSVKIGLLPAEDAFIAGLLHDIGKFVLANYFPQELAKTLTLAKEENQTFIQAEHSFAAWPHSHIGSYLAQRWMLPDELVQTIKGHHAMSEWGARPQLVTVVDVGNRLVHMMDGDHGYHLDPDVHCDSYVKIMTVALADGCRWYTEVRREMDDACQFFNKR